MFDQVIIKYQNGSIAINLDRFFPTSQGNTKKLLRIIDMDWKHKDCIIQNIKNWIEAEIGQCKSGTRKKKLQKNLKALQ